VHESRVRAVDAFEAPFWDLTTAAAWAVTREKDAVRMAADPDNEEALLDIRAAHLERWREVNERLWEESGWPKPDELNHPGAQFDDDVVRQAWQIPVDPICADGGDAIRRRVLRIFRPSLFNPVAVAEFRVRDAEREAHAKPLRAAEAKVFSIEDYLTSLFQAGRLTALVYPRGDAAAHAIPATDWAFLEIDGGDHQRLFVRRAGERGKAFDLRVARDEVLSVFPSRPAALSGTQAPRQTEGDANTPKGKPARGKPQMSDKDIKGKLKPFLKQLHAEWELQELRFNQVSSTKAAEEHFGKAIDRGRFREVYQSAGLNQKRGRPRKIPPES
jgi:hypothetical protein